jgi:glycosyltransferase involved in cell wall biosynthesis
MSARRTLLIVSYHFAPSPAVGAKRFSFLAREFSKLGYDVHVIANALPGVADATLPVAATVHRVAASVELPTSMKGRGWLARKAISFAHRLLAPVGAEYFWARAAERAALASFARHGARDGVVIATSPPHAALIAGERIARRLGWPLIVDYRDPWSAHDWPRWRRGRLSNALARRVESRIVAASAARVLNTPAMRENFTRFFPRAPHDSNHVIPNGFDAMAPAALPDLTGPIHLVHAGEIFTGRSLVPVLAAARTLGEKHARMIHITTFGDLPAPELQRIRAAGLERFVTVRPRIPFAELFLELQRAHALLAVVGDHMLYSTPYKVYDYMAAGRPILGLAPRGAALYDLLAESGAGTCVAPDDAAGVEQTLERMLFAHGATVSARVDRFRWSNLAQQYRGVIEAVAGGARTRASPEPGHALDH